MIDLPAILATLAPGPLCARALSIALDCRPAQVLSAIADAPDGWWHVEQFAGPTGWLYRVRPVVSARRRMPKEITHYANTPTQKGNYRT